jgi:LEA14-like dessication related protein
VIKNLRTYVILGGAGLIAFAIYKFYSTQFKLLKNIEYNLKNVKLNKITKDLISIDIIMKVNNYSNINATIKEMFLDLYINDVKVGNVQETKDILIKSGGQTDISFTFNVLPALILTNITQLLNVSLALKDAKVVATGYARMESGIIRAVVPFEYKTTIKEYLQSK